MNQQKNLYIIDNKGIISRSYQGKDTVLSGMIQ